MFVMGLGMNNGAKPAPNKKIAFGRAMTTAEMQVNKKLLTEGRESLGSGDSFMICFDSMFPSEKGKNTGIGTSFSDSGIDFLAFMKKMTGITFLQNGPQGVISKTNVSPFSGSVFAIGSQVIDLKDLTKNMYGKILPEEEYDKITQGFNSSKTEFESVLGSDGSQIKALQIAFNNFKQLSSNSPLKEKYEDFIDSQQDNWLERDSLYAALSEKHGNDYWKNWSDDLDKNLFSGKYPEDVVKERIGELEFIYDDAIDFNKFIQFVADQQQKVAKSELNGRGIKLAGDCLIGFSPRENWAYQSAFKPDTYIGCKSDNSIMEWGLPSIDFDKVGYGDDLGEAGQLLKRKFDLFFSRYDGARIDAAWQLLSPFLYEKKDDEQSKVVNTGYIGDKVLKIIDKSAEEHGVNPQNITYEMLGGPVDFRDSVLKDRTQIHHSIYQSSDWGSVKFYKDKGLSEDEFSFGLGTHDDKSLIELSDEKQYEQAPVLAKNLGMFDENYLKSSKSSFMRAKWAELFTTKNNFFTVLDALGVKTRFNDQKINPDNWTARVPENYEEVYFTNLQNGKGLNAPRALADAMKITHRGSNNLVERLYKAASVLEEEGPTTEQEANKLFGADYSSI